MRVYQLSDIERITSSPEFESSLIDAIANGFASYSQGKFNACPIQTMGAPPMAPFSCGTFDDDSNANKEYAAQVCIKSGYITGADHFVVKVASGGHPMPTNSGCMQVYSQHTGKMEALLLDNGLLTELRTAAAGAVAARYMSPKEVKQIGMLGTGIQARYQLQYLKNVTECRNLLVYGRTGSNVEAYVKDCEEEGWNVTVASCPDELLNNCELIVTTTTSREAVLGTTKGSAAAKAGGQHITCIGADAPGKMELDTSLVKSASLLVADSKLQTHERGEFEQVIKDGLVSLDQVVEIGKLVSKGQGDVSKVFSGRLSIFDSSGVAVQDCVIAQMVYSALAADKKKVRRAEGRS